MNAPLTDEQITELKATGRVATTQKQRDESFRGWYPLHAAEYALQYYVTGRYAVAAQFSPISASLLHHAVELLLKACLSRGDSADVIRQYGSRNRGYGHRLATLWTEFTRRNPDVGMGQYATVIEALDHFEDIRYPETLVQDGGMITIGMYEVEPPVGTPQNDRTYMLMLPQIDRLVAQLFQATGLNHEAFRQMLQREHANTYLFLLNATPILR